MGCLPTDVLMSILALTAPEASDRPPVLTTDMLDRTDDGEHVGCDEVVGGQGTGGIGRGCPRLATTRSAR
jgi:hypothetical protein